MLSVRFSFRARTLIALLFLALPAGTLHAQALYKVGFRAAKFPNPTNSGSKSLDCTLYYPARTQGKNAALLPRKGGWPVVVFLHGWRKYGYHYVEVGFALASSGWIAVLSDTAPANLNLQIQDGRALHPALVKENKTSTSWLAGALDTSNMALAGHSTGATNLFFILANNPGYSCGVSYGPWLGLDLKYGLTVMPKVTAPVLLLSGMGEKITPWKPHGKGAYDRLTGVQGLKCLFVLDKDGDHYNIVAYVLRGRPADKQVFETTHRAVSGFLRYVQGGDEKALASVLGGTARRSAKFGGLFATNPRPLYFQSGSTAIGTVSHLEVVALPGPALHLFSIRKGSLKTSWGTLLLNPLYLGFFGPTPVGASGWFDLSFRLPNDPKLRGMTFYFQALGASKGGHRFSNPTALPIR